MIRPGRSVGDALITALTGITQLALIVAGITILSRDAYTHTAHTYLGIGLTTLGAYLAGITTRPRRTKPKEPHQ